VTSPLLAANAAARQRADLVRLDPFGNCIAISISESDSGQQLKQRTW
jgi:hypothetical protein